MNIRMLLPMAAKKLVDYLKSNNGEIEFSMNEINNWAKKNKYPFRLLNLTDPDKGQILKLILEKQ